MKKIHGQCSVHFCLITPEACSSPEGPGQRWAEAKYRLK